MSPPRDWTAVMGDGRHVSQTDADRRGSPGKWFRRTPLPEAAVVKIVRGLPNFSLAVHDERARSLTGQLLP